MERQKANKINPIKKEELTPAAEYLALLPGGYKQIFGGFTLPSTCWKQFASNHLISFVSHIQSSLGV